MRIDEGFQAALQSEEYRERMLMNMRIVPLFLKFVTVEIDAVLKATKLVSFDPMEVLFEQSSDDRNLHVILDGSVLLYTNRGSLETIVGQRQLNSCFGEIAFITGGKRNTSAKAGAKGCTNLVVDAAEFAKLTGERPELMFKVLGTILDQITERLQDLPANFRNFVVWGLKRGGLGGEALEMDVMPLAGGFGVGAVIGGLAGSKLGAAVAKAYPVVAEVPYAGKAALWAGALLVGIVGLFVGWSIAIQKLRRMRGGIGPRCCMNCANVVWDGLEGRKFGCAYEALKLKGKVLRPGKDYDSKTDCPTFQYREIARLG